MRLRTWVEFDRVESGIGDVIATHLTRRLRETQAAASVLFCLSQAETADILRAGRGPDVHIEGLGGVHDAFVAVARARPGSIAVAGEGLELTYGELEESSRITASALIGRGVTVGERVGVCMDRTPHAIIALLAVLRAGACYVPLDPTHPAARRAYVAEDAGLRLVITDAGTATQLTGSHDVRLDELLNEPVAHELPDVGPDDPAYVIYTSGTTGRPKGAVIPHRNVLALIAATRQEFELVDSDVWTLFHSLAFDFSVWETWGCLLTGGRLVVVPYWTARTPAGFAQLLHAQRVTVLSQTPSAFANVMQVLVADDAPHDVRLVIFGGEALRTPMLAAWLHRFSTAACRLINMYGITETTVHVTWQDVTASDVVASSRSVGRALPGWSVSVRSADGQVLPFDVAGEIWVGGAGLALGYHDRPELTEERFPTDLTSGVRHYRSGDLGRLRPDGTLEHLGRIDDQVKIRGYRVELGEIRAALLNEPTVRDAVVAFDEDDEGGAIRAYIVAPATTVTDLRARLRSKLPDYMIPADMHLVTEFPLTANGKADLAALAKSTIIHDPAGPVPTSTDIVGEHPYLAMAVHRVWSDIFGAECLEMDFFDVGGNSLQALKISLALDDLGRRSVSPQDVYLNPTTADLITLLHEE